MSKRAASTVPLSGMRTRKKTKADLHNDEDEDSTTTLRASPSSKLANMRSSTTGSSKKATLSKVLKLSKEKTTSPAAAERTSQSKRHITKPARYIDDSPERKKSSESKSKKESIQAKDKNSKPPEPQTSKLETTTQLKECSSKEPKLSTKKTRESKGNGVIHVVVPPKQNKAVKPPSNVEEAIKIKTKDTTQASENNLKGQQLETKMMTYSKTETESVMMKSKNDNKCSESTASSANPLSSKETIQPSRSSPMTSPQEPVRKPALKETKTISTEKTIPTVPVKAASKCSDDAATGDDQSLSEKVFNSKTDVSPRNISEKATDVVAESAQKTVQPTVVRHIYNAYSRKDLEAALQMVVEGSTEAEASDKYKIPMSALNRWVEKVKEVSQSLDNAPSEDNGGPPRDLAKNIKIEQSQAPEPDEPADDVMDSAGNYTYRDVEAATNKVYRYTKDELEAALQMVMDGSTKAAVFAKYKIPTRSLNRWLDRVKEAAKSLENPPTSENSALLSNIKSEPVEAEDSTDGVMETAAIDVSSAIKKVCNSFMNIKDRIDAALKMVMEGSSVSEASSKHNISKSTVLRYVKLARQASQAAAEGPSEEGDGEGESDNVKTEGPPSDEEEEESDGGTDDLSRIKRVTKSILSIRHRTDAALKMVMQGSRVSEAAAKCKISKSTILRYLKVARQASRISAEEGQSGDKESPEKQKNEGSLTGDSEGSMDGAAETPVLPKNLYNYLMYSSEDLEAALQMVLEGASVHRASKQYKIPFRSLKRWVEKAKITPAPQINVPREPRGPVGKRYCTWTDADMEFALQDVLDGARVRQAAQSHNIPVGTLRAWLARAEIKKPGEAVTTVPPDHLDVTLLRHSRRARAASRKYTTEDLRSALDELLGGAQVTATSYKYNIPTETLRSRIKVMKEKMERKSQVQLAQVTAEVIPAADTAEEEEYESDIHGVIVMSENADNITAVTEGDPALSYSIVDIVDGGGSSEAVTVVCEDVTALEQRTIAEMVGNVTEGNAPATSKTVSAVPSSTTTPGGRPARTYTLEGIEKAKALVAEGVPLKTAARTYKIPAETLRSRINNGTIVDRRRYVPPHMHREDEAAMVRHVLRLRADGEPVSVEWICRLAGKIQEHRGKPFPSVVPSYSWWKRLKTRHPELREVTVPRVIDAKQGGTKRSRASVLDRFFLDARTLLVSLDMLDAADRIYDLDECCIGGGPTTERKSKVVLASTEMNCESVTVTRCVSASGAWQPTMFTFEAMLPLTHDYIENGPAHSINIATSDGKPDKECYLLYLKHMEPHLNQQRPVVIFHNSLINNKDAGLINFCSEHHIYLMAYPKTKVHVLQPLELLFDDFKEIFTAKYQEAGILLSPDPIGKGKIPILMRFALHALEKNNRVQNAFREAGLCPLYHEAINGKSNKPGQISSPMKTATTTSIATETLHIDESSQAVSHLISEIELADGPCNKVVDVKSTSPMKVPEYKQRKDEGELGPPMDLSLMFMSPREYNIERMTKVELERKEKKLIKEIKLEQVVQTEEGATVPVQVGIINADGYCTTCLEQPEELLECYSCNTRFHLSCCEAEHGYSARVCPVCTNNAVAITTEVNPPATQETIDLQNLAQNIVYQM